MRIYQVPHEMVTDFWSAIEPMLSRAIDLNPHLDMPGVLRHLMAQYAQLFVATDDGEITAVAVMERIQYPSHVVGNILALAGKRGTYRSHLDALSDRMEQWAKEVGCDRIAFVGRPGLERIARRRGGKTLRLVHAWRDLSPGDA